jgi:hypothetical protein
MLKIFNIYYVPQCSHFSALVELTADGRCGETYQRVEHLCGKSAPEDPYGTRRVKVGNSINV